MIQLTVFLSGAALMALEMLGSRILAPTFGNSIFVWGSLIGVVLTALSLGAYLGGRLADRFPEPAPLAGGVALAGLWVWLVPPIAAGVNPWLERMDLGPRQGPVLAALLLFAGPSLLMALVPPWAIRLTARTVASMGSTAGNLSALGTAGSIIGTLATAFLLIPAMGVAGLTRGIGLVLVGLAGLNLAYLRRVGATGGVALLLVVLVAWAPLRMGSGAGSGPGSGPGSGAGSGAGAGGARDTAVGPIAGGKEEGVLFETDSLYHHIRVQNVNGTRLLRFDDSYQSGMYLDDPLKYRFDYTEVMMLPFALRPQAGRALLVGLGGGSMVKHMLAYLPDLRLDVAELDPTVISVARTYFGVPEHPRLSATAQDGRQFLVRATERYDVVLLDAYYASAIPFHLTTREFMQVTHDRMSPDGVLAANIIGSIEGPKSMLLRTMVATIASVFKQVYIFPVGSRPVQEYQNVIVIATKDERALGADEVIRAAQAARIGVPLLPGHAAAMLRKPLPTDDVKLLTDDFAPVDNLMHLYQ